MKKKAKAQTVQPKKWVAKIVVNDKDHSILIRRSDVMGGAMFMASRVGLDEWVYCEDLPNNWLGNAPTTTIWYGTISDAALRQDVLRWLTDWRDIWRDRAHLFPEFSGPEDENETEKDETFAELQRQVNN